MTMGESMGQASGFRGQGVGMGPCDHAAAEGFAAPTADFGIAGLLVGFQVESDWCCHDWVVWRDLFVGRHFTHLAQQTRHTDLGTAAWAALNSLRRFGLGLGNPADGVRYPAFSLGNGGDGASGNTDVGRDLAVGVLPFFEELLDFANDIW